MGPVSSSAWWTVAVLLAAALVSLRAEGQRVRESRKP